MFVFEAVKAKHGDALLLHADKSLIMVDGGPSKVYDNFLKKRLKSLRTGGNPLKINMLMISHIDDDHIKGVLDFTEELLDAKQERRQPLAKIGHLWHNSFSDNILQTTQTASSTSEANADGAMALAGLAEGDNDFGDVIQESTQFVLSSVRQGRSLRRNAGQLRLKSNHGFENGLVLRDDNQMTKKRVGKFSLGVIGPSNNELKKLRNKWKSDLKKILKPDTPRVSALELAANLDNSIANLSSLVVEVTAANKTALITGDARSDHILKAMAEIGWKDAANQKWPVDLLKLPHHGSDRNVTKTFFEKVPAKHYVVSGDGKHGNPEPDTFDMILTARGNDQFKIHMTYSPDELRRDHEFAWQHFKSVMNKHEAWDRLRFPAPGKSSLKVKLA